MIESFIRYIQYEKRYSSHTIISYQTDLTQLSVFLQATFPEISTEFAEHYEIRSWIVSLVEQGLDQRSVNRKLAALRSYYKFLLKREIISKDPTIKLRSLKTSKPLPHFVPEKDLLQMLDNHDFGPDFKGLRDKVVMELLYGTGIRLAELLDLKEDDINLYEQTIKVLGKRKKERIIPFSKSIVQIIESYRLAKNKKGFSNDEGFFIVSINGKRCYPMAVYRTVRKYLDNCTTIDKRSPHVLRHTFATHLLNKGAELNAVKDLLGHSSLAATQVYTHHTLEKIKSVFDQAHPKA